MKRTVEKTSRVAGALILLPVIFQLSQNPRFFSYNWDLTALAAAGLLMMLGIHVPVPVALAAAALLSAAVLHIPGYLLVSARTFRFLPQMPALLAAAILISFWTAARAANPERREKLWFLPGLFVTAAYLYRITRQLHLLPHAGQGAFLILYSRFG